MAINIDSGAACWQGMIGTCITVLSCCSSPHNPSFSQPNVCLCVAEAYLRVHSENTWSLPGYSNHLEGEFMVKTAPISTSDV